MGVARRLSIIGGAVTLAAIGRDRFSLAMQGDGWLGRMLRVFADDTEVAELLERRRYIREHLMAPRRSKRSAEEYGDDDLAGYGTDTVRAGDQGEPLEQQLRGLALPEIYAILDKAALAARVVEVGHGNGDLLAHLATRYPQHRFTGIDFSTKSASRYQAPNLAFVAGYALDDLEAGTLAGDVLFAASTFCYAGPLEMRNYAKAIRAAGFSNVVISDMCSKVWTPEAYPGRSLYLHKGVCGHDYGGIFSEVGYATSTYGTVSYGKHRRRGVVRMQVYAGSMPAPL